jgi:hypothetical protein
LPGVLRPPGANDSDQPEKPSKAHAHANAHIEDMGPNALESATPPVQRAGYAILATGAAIVVLGGTVWVSSRMDIDPNGRATAKATWPWLMGGGAALMVSGLGVLGYSFWFAPTETTTSSSVAGGAISSANTSASPGTVTKTGVTLGAQAKFQFDLDPGRGMAALQGWH